MKHLGPRTVVLYGDESGCSLWRCWWPVTALKFAGYPAAALHRDSPKLPRYLLEADAVVLSRLSWSLDGLGFAKRWIDSLHALGIAVIADWDDDVFSDACVPQVQLLAAAHEPWKAPADLEAERQGRLATLGLMDAVTVPTQRLATVLRQYTDKPVHVVPNAIRWPDFQRVCQQAPRRVDGLTIGWVGGRRLDHDFDQMVLAWQRIAARHPEVTFVVAGFHPASILEAIPPEQLVLQPWLEAPLYPQAYRDVDLLCCPLANSPFNRCKSAIKSYEGAAAGAAVVASPTVYGAVMRDGKDGLIVQTADEWEAALERLVTDGVYRRRLAARWARRVQERHSLETQMYRWPEAWGAAVVAYRERATRPVSRLWVPA